MAVEGQFIFECCPELSRLSRLSMDIGATANIQGTAIALSIPSNLVTDLIED
ncbi:hypothetical protein NG799_01445 [Laspinema sp. D1]|uniref:Uncharacterized protein n=1 Tax=Laspinema palackyanum D2a TaxID=2953684 RepID=A0ABT2MLX7_9CYAN|nr:hypothetical protein [Laspinema sp. D2a]